MLRLLHPFSCSSFAFLRLNINNFFFISGTSFTHKSVLLLYETQPSFLDYGKGDFPSAEKASEEVLSLSIYPELRKEEREYVVEKMWEFFGLSTKNLKGIHR
ncbi:MAG: DegT/DnrJ/EryC1/StrS family aminotransferase [Candidatus Syntrophoarchaeum sp.]|nr:DegT/DnrJ/EryC1/StrS family aminotransferase [Candidatus Syntrophoarchaeum sp.]